MTIVADPLDVELLVRRYAIRVFRNGAAAWVKDGIHDMAVVLAHDGERVTLIRGWMHGFPWTTCPGAMEQLRTFLGAPVRGSRRAPSVDQSAQCTHLFDLARLALVWTGREGGVRYDVVVARRTTAPEELLDAWVERDGHQVLRWAVRDYVVAAPADMAGHPIDGRANLPEQIATDPDRFEATMMLRRAVKMFRGRDRAAKMVEDIPPGDRDWMMGACYTFQPRVAAEAERAAPRLHATLPYS